MPEPPWFVIEPEDDEEFEFTDYDRTISQLYRKDLVPPGQAEELIAAGHVHGRGWIQTVGLPRPRCTSTSAAIWARPLCPPG